MKRKYDIKIVNGKLQASYMDENEEIIVHTALEGQGIKRLKPLSDQYELYFLGTDGQLHLRNLNSENDKQVNRETVYPAKAKIGFEIDDKNLSVSNVPSSKFIFHIFLDTQTSNKLAITTMFTSGKYIKEQTETLEDHQSIYFPSKNVSYYTEKGKLYEKENDVVKEITENNKNIAIDAQEVSSDDPYLDIRKNYTKRDRIEKVSTNMVFDKDRSLALTYLLEQKANGTIHITCDGTYNADTIRHLGLQDGKVLHMKGEKEVKLDGELQLLVLKREGKLLLVHGLLKDNHISIHEIFEGDNISFYDRSLHTHKHVTADIKLDDRVYIAGNGDIRATDLDRDTIINEIQRKTSQEAEIKPTESSEVEQPELTIDPLLTSVNRETVNKAIYLKLENNELFLVRGTEKKNLRIGADEKAIYDGISYIIRDGKIFNAQDNSDLGQSVKISDSDEDLSNFMSRIPTEYPDDVSSRVEPDKKKDRSLLTIDIEPIEDTNNTSTTNNLTTKITTSKLTAQLRNGQTIAKPDKKKDISPSTTIKDPNNQSATEASGSKPTAQDSPDKVTQFVDNFFKPSISKWTSKTSTEAVKIFKNQLIDAFQGLESEIPTTEEDQQLYANKILRALGKIEFNDKGASFIDNIGRKNGATISKTIIDCITSLFLAFVHNDYSIWGNYLKDKSSLIIKDTEKFQNFLNAKPTEKEVTEGINNLENAIISAKVDRGRSS